MDQRKRIISQESYVQLKKIKLDKKNKKIKDEKAKCDDKTKEKMKKNNEKEKKYNEMLKLDTKIKEKRKENSETEEKNKNDAKTTEKKKGKSKKSEKPSKGVGCLVETSPKHSKMPTTTKINQCPKNKNDSETKFTKQAPKSHIETCLKKIIMGNLTTNNDMFFALLRFARIKVLKDIIYTECKLLPSVRKIINGKLATDENYLYKAVIYKPNLGYDSVPLVIDLTSGCDEIELQIISEKECVNKIFTFINEFYNYYSINSTEEVGAILDTEDDCLNTFFKKGKFLGLDLIKELKYRRIRNFDFARFLSFVVVKFEQSVEVFILPTAVAVYLHLMLRQNRDLLDNKLLENLFNESTKMMQMERIKLEKNSENTEVASQE